MDRISALSQKKTTNIPNEGVIENPFSIEPIAGMRYFICPLCEFKSQCKQEFMKHARGSHPESVDYLNESSKLLKSVFFNYFKALF